ncbi:MAG: hypothetical protein ACKVS7_10810 [Gemmatimonadaceae bacterium]
MFSRDLYEIVHILGIALTMLAFGGIVMHASEGGTWKGPRSRTMLKVAHHVGVFLILLGGFGMLARIGIAKGGIATFPGWLWAKIALWVVLAGVVSLPYKQPRFALPAFFAVPTLSGLAVYFALYKPF